MESKKLNVILRAPEPSDVDCIYLWENEMEGWGTTGNCGLLSRHQIWEYVNGYDANPFSASQVRLIVDLDGKACGMVDLYDISPRNRTANVGIYIADVYRGRGIGFEALTRLNEFARKKLGLFSVGAMVVADNLKSAELFDRTGYVRVGKFVDWIVDDNGRCDAIQFQLIL